MIKNINFVRMSYTIRYWLPVINLYVKNFDVSKKPNQHLEKGDVKRFVHYDVLIILIFIYSSSPLEAS